MTALNALPLIPAGSAQPSPASLSASFHPIGDCAVGGWVLDPQRPGHRFVVEIRADGEHVALALAETFSAEVRDLFGGDGCHGFAAVLSSTQLEAATTIEAVIANTGVVIGTIDRTTAAADDARPRAVVGEALWIGGLRVSGYAYDFGDPGRPAVVEVHVDGDLVCRVAADKWRDMGDGSAVPSGRVGFDIALPLSMADGAPHALRASVNGVDLGGSPTTVIVHDGGFAGLAGELDPDGRSGALIRARLLDRLMPGALPLSEAASWLGHFPVEEPIAAIGLVAVLVIGDEDAAAATMTSLERQDHPGWIGFQVPTGASPEEDAAALEDARKAIADAGADWVAVVAAGARLDPLAIGHLAAALEHRSAPGLVYADIVCTVDGKPVPMALPAYDRFRMRSQAYCADLFAVPVDRFEQPFPPSLSSACDLLLWCTGSCEDAAEPVGHVPQFLAVLPERDAAQRAETLARAVEADLARRGKGPVPPVEPVVGRVLSAVSVGRSVPLDGCGVSIIIPTRDRLDLLKPCVESIIEHTRGIDYEIVVVDNGSRDEATLAYLSELADLGHGVVRADIPFNYATLNNIAVEHARHPLLCLLNNDVEVLEPDWLAQMAALLHEDDVGIVGATLLWPSRIIQHGGVVVGSHMAAHHAFTACLDGESGYGDMLLCERQHSAVTAACLLLRREDYVAVGGLDEVAFPVNFNDVDLCLKVGRLGKAVVMSPRARLLHKESASRGQDLTREKHARSRKELAALRERWAEVLGNDPFYNPNLGLDLFPFEGLATPPRHRGLRLRPSRPGRP
ncbi:glycosyltransferase family 2 protein [Alsobacter sp. R-9]